MRSVNIDEVDLDALAQNAEAHAKYNPDLGTLGKMHKHSDDEGRYLERYP